MQLVRLLPMIERLYHGTLVVSLLILWVLSMLGAGIQLFARTSVEQAVLIDIAERSANGWLLSVLHLIGCCLAWGLQRAKGPRLSAPVFFVVSALAVVAMVATRPALTPLALVYLVYVSITVVPHVGRIGLASMLGSDAVVMFIVITYATPLLTQNALSPAESVVHMIGLVLGGVMIITITTPLYRFWYLAMRQTDNANVSLRRAETALRQENAERVRAGEALTRQNRYLAALHETSKELVQRMTMRDVVDDIVRRARRLVDANHAFVSLRGSDGVTLETTIAVGMFAPGSGTSKASLRRRDALASSVIGTGEPLIIGGNSGPGVMLTSLDDPMRAVVVMPLQRDGRAIGALGLAHDDPERAFDPDQIQAIERFAALAGVALDNAILYEASRANEVELESRVAERTREITAILNIANTLSTTFDLNQLLSRLLLEIKELITCTSGAVMISHDIEHLRTVVRHGPLISSTVGEQPWPLRGVLAEVFYGQKPLMIPDLRDPSDPRAAAFNNYINEQSGSSVNGRIMTVLCVPILAHDQAVGVIVLHNERTTAYTSTQIDLALTIARQAGLAIENARMHTQTVQAAAAAERSRLARDLHDSVSQAIFGISLGAKSMERLAAEDPARVLEPLPYVVNLANAALTEMRALIFELRPESLEQEGLLSALQKQSAAMAARHNLRVVEDFGAHEPQASLKVKEAFYRIAMEALHNVIKYARAQSVQLTLQERDDALELVIRDDGVGFNPQLVPPGHFGLKSMRERVSQLGGSIDIESAPGYGTRISVRIKRQQMNQPIIDFNIAPAT
jgi:signal transduction histidine kinase